MNIIGTGSKLDDLDLPRIGQTIGVGEDEIHMVMEVETRGGGFDDRNRLKMLFEPHIFYRQLGPGIERDQAVKQGLAYKRWGTLRYPSDSYPRFLTAQRINKDAALRSASWGLGQVMGFNCRLAGYDSAEDMVNDFLLGEAQQLQGMINFIESAGLDDELRALADLNRPTTPQDCVPFVRGYNGSGYAKHKYHIKAAAAHNKWRAIKDTPFEFDRDGVVNPNEQFLTENTEPEPNAVTMVMEAAQPARLVHAIQTDQTDQTTANAEALRLTEAATSARLDPQEWSASEMLETLARDRNAVRTAVQSAARTQVQGRLSGVPMDVVFDLIDENSDLDGSGTIKHANDTVKAILTTIGVSGFSVAALWEEYAALDVKVQVGIAILIFALVVVSYVSNKGADYTKQSRTKKARKADRIRNLLDAAQAAGT